MACKSVLAVEDDPDIRSLMVHSLELEGYEVLQASNGKVALQVLQKLPPEKWPGCILLDLMMPEMDGFAFLREVHENYPDTLAKIPVIVTTATGSEPGAPHLKYAKERIHKPLLLTDLYAVVQKHCGKPT